MNETYTREEALWETKKNVLGLATKDGRKQYQMLAQDKWRWSHQISTDLNNFT